MRTKLILFAICVLINHLFSLATAEENNITPHCASEELEPALQDAKNVATTDISSPSLKDRIKNWGVECFTFFKNLTTQEENLLNQKLNVFKNFLISILNWIPYKIQITFLEALKFICATGLPRPLNIVMAFGIEKFILFLETRKKDADDKLKEKSMAINMGLIRSSKIEPAELGIRYEHDRNGRILEMITQNAVNLEKIYLIMMNRVLYTYLNNYFKNLDVSKIAAADILKTDKV